jgi:hypothetical protein
MAGWVNPGRQSLRDSALGQYEVAPLALKGSIEGAGRWQAEFFRIRLQCGAADAGEG